MRAAVCEPLALAGRAAADTADLSAATSAATAAGAGLLAAPCAAAPLSVRPLAPSDFHAVKAAHGQLFPIDYDDGFFHKATHGLDRIFSWGAFEAGGPGGGEQLVGFVTARVVRLHECDTQDRHHMGLLSLVLDHDCAAYILTLGVLAGWRGRGVASRLIGLVTAYAAEIRCRAVFLHVITYNDAAIRLYTRAGFTCAGRLPSFYYIHTGRQPDPSTCVYDALLFVHHTAPDWGYSGWDVVALAVSPLRAAWGRIYGCMPQLGRHPGHHSQQLQLIDKLPHAPTVQHGGHPRQQQQQQQQQQGQARQGQQGQQPGDGWQQWQQQPQQQQPQWQQPPQQQLAPSRPRGAGWSLWGARRPGAAQAQAQHQQHTHRYAHQQHPQHLQQPLLHPPYQQLPQEESPEAVSGRHAVLGPLEAGAAAARQPGAFAPPAGPPQPQHILRYLFSPQWRGSAGGGGGGVADSNGGSGSGRDGSGGDRGDGSGGGGGAAGWDGAQAPVEAGTGPKGSAAWGQAGATASRGITVAHGRAAGATRQGGSGGSGAPNGHPHSSPRSGDAPGRAAGGGW